MHSDPAFIGLYGMAQSAARPGAAWLQVQGVTMGREVEAQVRFQGQTGLVRAIGIGAGNGHLQDQGGGGI
ncbi:MAG: hypothetical protein RLZZ437_3348 [Pseudomonadota bacterium]|jgi:hypothetical protein